jgi:hypothetical protein
VKKKERKERKEKDKTENQITGSVPTPPLLRFLSDLVAAKMLPSRTAQPAKVFPIIPAFPSLPWEAKILRQLLMSDKTQ